MSLRKKNVSPVNGSRSSPFFCEAIADFCRQVIRVIAVGVESSFSRTTWQNLAVSTVVFYFLQTWTFKGGKSTQNCIDRPKPKLEKTFEKSTVFKTKYNSDGVENGTHF